MDRYRHGAAQPNPTKSVKETTDEHRQTQMCATRPKILRDPARIFLRPPGSAGILSSSQRYKDPTRSCPSESSWLRVFVVRFFGVPAALLRVHLCSSVVSFCTVYADENALAPKT